jgi:pyruvate/2-oxoglutarate dehydrogenase complex dihydrolipoamide acyltransferase (E2) component
MSAVPVAAQRRHTLHFLDGIRDFAPVYLDTEVDMSRVRADRANTKYSVVTYLLYVAARVLVAHPEANAAFRGGLRPRVARFPGASGKLTLDRTVDGQRVVLAAVLPDLDRASLPDIQAMVDYYRDGNPATLPEFERTRRVDRLPLAVGRLLVRAARRSLGNRPAMMGTFAVTSLGHRSVDAFHSVGGTTVTFGVGRILDRPVVRDGQIVVAPVMRLSLSFDHRVIDGAEAADILTEVATGLTDCSLGER